MEGVSLDGNLNDSQFYIAFAGSQSTFPFITGKADRETGSLRINTCTLIERPCYGEDRFRDQESEIGQELGEGRMWGAARGDAAPKCQRQDTNSPLLIPSPGAHSFTMPFKFSDISLKFLPTLAFSLLQ